MTNLFLITAIHLAALSQIESGDNDRAVGSSGEITRFQIMPNEWFAVAHRLELHLNRHLCPSNREDAELVAISRWSKWVATFELAYHRPPTLSELYLCWHRPGRVMQPTAKERERAERFSNLVESMKDGR